MYRLLEQTRRLSANPRPLLRLRRTEVSRTRSISISNGMILNMLTSRPSILLRLRIRLHPRQFLLVINMNYNSNSSSNSSRNHRIPCIQIFRQPTGMIRQCRILRASFRCRDRLFLIQLLSTPLLQPHPCQLSRLITILTRLRLVPQPWGLAARLIGSILVLFQLQRALMALMYRSRHLRVSSQQLPLQLPTYLLLHHHHQAIRQVYWQWRHRPRQRILRLQLGVKDPMHPHKSALLPRRKFQNLRHRTEWGVWIAFNLTSAVSTPLGVLRQLTMSSKLGLNVLPR